jgi:DNA polymerase V
MLESVGVKTALQLRELPDAWVKKRMSVTGLRMVRELRGEPCIALEDAPPAKKQIICSRSFGKFLTELQQIEEAMTFYASRAAERMRSQNLVTSDVMVWFETSRFSGSFYAPSKVMHLERMTNYTPDIVKATLTAVREAFRKGYRYRKGGVMLLELSAAKNRQYDLLSPRNEPKQEAMMTALDAINKKFGSNTLFYAAAGIRQEWQMMRQMKSPHYTTMWGELPVAHV